MYNSAFSFILAGLSADAASAIKGTAPPDGVSCSFDEVDSVPESVPEGTTAIIFSGEAADLSGLSRRAWKSVKLVFSGDAAGLSEEELSCVSEIWPPLSESLARFCFGNFLAALKAEHDARLSALILDVTIHTVPNLVWYKTRDGAYVKVNEAFSELVERTEDEIVGRRHSEVWVGPDGPDDDGELADLSTDQETIERCTTCAFDEAVKNPGGRVQLHVRKSPLWDSDGRLIGVVGVGEDVTKLKEYEAELVRAANTDELTGLPNRRYFMKQVNEKRGDGPVVIGRFDLLYFKQLNETYGPGKGDEALVAVAEALKDTFGEALLCRFGGGEFLIAMTGGHSVGEAKAGFAVMLARLRAICERDASPILLSANMGITSTDDPELSLDRLIRQSDLALYYTKSLGDGQCCVFADIVSE